METQIITIDCGYVAPEVAAAYLLVRNGKAVFIDNNTRYAIPLLLQALEDQGLAPQDVEYVVVTHVHLDHAGGSGPLMDACAQARLLCHPRAARHLISPERLSERTRAVYGDDRFRELYGELTPVPAERVCSVDDGEVVAWHGSQLEFYHTPGHAPHHLVVAERSSKSVFSGDAFGVAYPLLQRNGQLVLPTSPPADFDAELSIASARRIAALGCTAVYPTHFGRIPGTATAALPSLEDGFHHYGRIVDTMAAQLLAGRPVHEIEQECRVQVDAYVQARLDEAAVQLSTDEWELLGLDRELNAMGLAFAAGRRARKLNKA
ncbi:MBL fold metallo-hydrolase [Spirochaeta africana]|uniref:Zn-dependent hydrolase, glyoxylase n=1 Tax=Spirochaeta africana (strain ATCC 700263 / DSM 8902 / Z-7692) TaxID=889378 RepID=H9UK56_SPIAZ|nr:MBL fold metallo-hydrolase [Spirochaeta africana]AFG37899.1 Zn-dependent hydrolase, glyoxylase [Spirochaeta africana DSM 8902]